MQIPRTKVVKIKFELHKRYFTDNFIKYDRLY